jgi:peptide/nickel transport system permease protein
MLKYILKRILIFIPTLFAISLLTFVISLNAPGDPVDTMLNKNAGGEGQASQKLATEKAYNALRHQLGFDLPVFYFAFTNASCTDTLYRIPKKNQREVLQRLAFQYGNWNDVADYYHQTQSFENTIYSLPKTEANAAALIQVKDYISSLYDTYDNNRIKTIFSNLDFTFNNNPEIRTNIGFYNATKESYNNMLINSSPYTRYIPTIHWYGFNNQYHRWITHFLAGDFGISYQDKRPVASVIWDAIRWTLLLSTLSMFLAYIIAIPLGVKSAINRGERSEKITTTVLFALYSLPNFWIATMLIIFFGGGDYFDVFPAFGLGTLPDDAPFWDRFSETAFHLVLPLLCLTYVSLAFISRQMRGSMLNVIGQDYIRTARAKGLEEKTVVWKHALKNSLLPIITLFASIFPLAIAGSFAIEWIFSIPGMGKISLEALTARNYPIVFTVMMFTAILTLVGNLVADILYAAIDPRISFSSGK